MNSRQSRRLGFLEEKIWFFGGIFAHEALCLNVECEVRENIEQVRATFGAFVDEWETLLCNSK